MSGYHSKVLSRLELRPGHHVLDAGCGPGIFTTAIAGIVAPNGFVLALDVQPGMIEKTRTRVVKSGLRNIDYLIAPLGAGKLPRSRFDRAILVTVLGEIPDKVAALKEIQASLKPGGFLSITEVLPDPHYQSLGRILNLTEQSGLRFRNRFGNLLMFTVNVEKPV
jgi:ubiquinone/menaquinone biosynthesis C-methylase UbiE